MYTEVSKYPFTCTQCGKKFSINGHWYNQWILHHYLDCKFLLHELIKHHKKITKKTAKVIFKYTIGWVPLILFQILDIILEPLRRIL